MEMTDDGMMTRHSELQNLNALLPINVTEDGMNILSNELQFMNALSPIV
jgi:hypothetical protein